jgi:hypothetical protein
LHVVARPIDLPVALVEQPYQDALGRQRVLQVLVFRTGLLATPVLEMLRKVLRHV